MLRVGNDIVDLSEEETLDKHLNSRFINKAFHGSETDSIQQSQTPNATLWFLWAAKESCYKVISKKHNKEHFSPKRFTVLPTQYSMNRQFDWTMHATCKYQDMNLSILGKIEESYVFCVAWQEDGKNPNQLNSFQDDITFAERHLLWHVEKISAEENTPSDLVRLSLIKNLAPVLGLPKKTLAIHRDTKPDRTSPPMLFSDGHPPNTDITLSHHGQWISWAATRATTKSSRR